MFTTQQLILLSKFWLQTLRLKKARHFPVNFIKIVTLSLQFHNIMAEDGNGFNRENVRLRTKHQPAKKGSEQVKRQIIFGHVEVKKGSKR